MKKGFSLAEGAIIILFMTIAASLAIPSAMSGIARKQHKIAYNTAFKYVQKALIANKNLTAANEANAQNLWENIGKTLQVQGYSCVNVSDNTFIKGENLKTKATWKSNEEDSAPKTIGSGSGSSNFTCEKVNRWSPWIITDNGIAYSIEVHSTTDAPMECESVQVINQQTSLADVVKKSCAQIMVDLNGLGKGPNSFVRQGALSSESQEYEFDDNILGYDRFRIYVGKDGITAGPKSCTETGRMNAKCIPGFYTKNGGCILCESGYRCKDGKEREECPDKTYSDVGQSECTNCELPDKCLNCTKSGGECNSCEAGYKLSSDKKCESCDITNCTGYSSGCSCSTCSAGFEIDSDENKCAACSDTNCISFSSGCSCSQCKNGYYISNNECTKCPAGSKCSDGKNKEACPAGKYSNEGATSCTDCPAGTYSSQSGSASCSNCSAGTYSAAGASSCSNCSAGTYSAAGASSCSNCSAGTYSAAGASSCSNCSAGTYSLAGASSCTNCPAGKYSLAGASSCTNCPAGTYSAAGASSCTNCNNTNCKSFSSGCTCSQCNSGYYLSNGVCTQCTAGYKCSDGIKREACPAGTYSLAGASSCSKCSKGKYSLEGASSCTNCPDGTYSSEEGSSSCTSCGAGCVTCNSITGTCSACGRGYDKISNDHKCTSCSSIYGDHCNNWAQNCRLCHCTECERGYYRIIVRGYTQAEMRNCNNMTFNNIWKCVPCDGSSEAIPHCSKYYTRTEMINNKWGDNPDHNDCRCKECESGYERKNQGQECRQKS